jgi:hypothetical protein
MVTYPVTGGYANLTIGGGGGAGAGTISITGAGGPQGAVLTAANGTGTTWASTTAQGQLKVEGKDADIFINGKSLSDWMSAVDRRLSILVPNPEQLEKYESLREAYEHYKTLEALLYEEK